MLDRGPVAAEELDAEGIDVTVWDVRVVSHPDPAMLADAARHRLVITVEDGVRMGGAGMYLADPSVAGAQKDWRAWTGPHRLRRLPGHPPVVHRPG